MGQIFQVKKVTTTRKSDEIEAQVVLTCQVPLDSVPRRSYALLMARLFLNKVRIETLCGSLS